MKMGMAVLVIPMPVGVGMQTPRQIMRMGVFGVG